MPGIRIEPAAPDAAQTRDHAERILRSIPEWFGIEEATLAYIDAAAHLPTWFAFTPDHPDPVGFVTLHRHFPETWEIHCIAVLAGRHRRGVGAAMVEHACEYCRGQGATYLQVKTLGPSREDANYAATRLFYVARGFIPLEEFPTLWGRNPALMLVRHFDLRSS